MNQLNPFAPSEQPKQAPVLTARESSTAVAEVQAAMAIARMNPRDQIMAMDRILNACTRPTLADSAIYSYAKGGTDITGPSIRLAETLAQNWGNISFGIRELETKQGESTVQSYCWDMETNTRREITFTVEHIRYTKKGTYKLEDPREVYELIANQGSRRLRACILSVIPGDVTEAAVNQCEVTMKAKADISPEGIKKMTEAFAKFGVTQQQIEKFIQRRMDTIQPAQLVRLKKVYASIKDGMSKPSEWFEDMVEKPENADNLNNVIAGKAANKPPKVETKVHEAPPMETKTDETNWEQMIEDSTNAEELQAIFDSLTEADKAKYEEQYLLKMDLMR